VNGDTLTLVADRFRVDDRRTACAIDLATAQYVRLVVAAAGDAADQRRWLVRCDELYRLRHPALATLIDYGHADRAQRFEAWLCDAPWSGAPDLIERTVTAARVFLRRMGMTVGQEGAWLVCHRGPRPVAIAPETAGYFESTRPSAERDELGLGGISLIERPAVAGLTEVFQIVDDRRPRVAALWGPDGSGRTTAIFGLARMARVNGFVPIDRRVLEASRDAIGPRSLFIVDRDDDTHPTDAWLGATLRDPRAHVCVVVREEPPAGIDAVALRRLDVEDLAAAVRPAPAGEEAARVRVLAQQSLGLPGAFVARLWRLPLSRPRRTRVALSRVAEQNAAYGDAGVDLTSVADAAQPVRWAAPGELVALRRRVEAAHALLASGRHAPGLRLLRQAIGGLARRDAWGNAAHGALTLAAELLHRGRPQDALKALDEAREYASRSGNGATLIEVAVLTGDAWIDLARLDEAERVLTAALGSARADSDRWRASLAATSLARCLFWRGACADAASFMNAEPIDTADSSSAVRRLRRLACVTIARGAPAGALAAVEEARAVAVSRHDDRLLADVEHTSAFIRLRIGDLDGVDRDAAACVALARAVRRPMRALSARLLLIEAERRRNAAGWRGALHALRRLAAAAPPLFRARWDLLNALGRSSDVPTVVSRHVASTGLHALELFAGEQPRGSRSGEQAGREAFVDEILAILRVCHTADDESTVLAHVCTRVRRHVHAAAVCFMVTRGGACEAVATDGPRIDAEVAERAIETGLTIGPHRVRERLEGAAAIQYGGETIGALCARWTPGTMDDLSRVAAILSMAATAAAPVVAALIARRPKRHATGADELLGVTGVMVELRQSVERAAAAPFGVLVEGESGSGKELVARALHRCGPRRDRPFGIVNCAALPDDLLEAELFGHARGSFTGAIADRPGVFENAHGGTLFLDEVGELSARAQAKLLRVIQEGELRRIGENTARRVDVRIVSATNRDLRNEVEKGRFRMDLLYRLDVIRITVPPLRDRREDIPVLVDHFWSDATRRIGSRAMLAPRTRAVLAGYNWPGNVRELQNVLAALAVRCPKRGVVPASALPAHLVGISRPEAWRLDAARRSFEEGFVRSALIRTGGHRGRAAGELGVTRQGLNKLMARLGIT